MNNWSDIAGKVLVTPVSNEDRNNVSLTGDAPKVSIIILNQNKAALSMLSARSVLAAEIKVPFELIIADNGSAPDDRWALANSDIPARIFQIPVNRFFGEGNNLAAEIARGEFLLFLNNDAFITRGLVEELLAAFDVVPNCGASGPVFRYPNGEMQEVGAMIRPDGVTVQRGKRDPAFSLHNVERYDPVDYVSAACLMMRSGTFSALGGFNYRFDSGYYEDADFCMRLKLKNQTVVVAKNALCVHIENATSGEWNRAKLDSTLGHHKRAFVSIWGQYLKTRSVFDFPKGLIASRPALVSKPSRAAASETEVCHAVMSCDPLVPGAGERFILATAAALSGVGGSAFVSPEPYSHVRLANVMRDLGLAQAGIRAMSEDRMMAKRFDRFLLMGNEVYPSRQAQGKSSLFYCHFPRQLSAAEVKDLDRELDRLEGYKRVIVASNFVRDAYRSALSESGCSIDLAVVAPPVGTRTLASLDAVRKPWIISVGRFSDLGRAKRQDVLIDAFRAMPRRFRRDWKLLLCGAVPSGAHDRDYFDRITRAARSERNIEFVVSPSAEQLQSLLAQSAVYVSATGFGVTDSQDHWKCDPAGIGVVEALAAGCRALAFGIGGAGEIFARVGGGRTYDNFEELVAMLESSDVSGLDVATRRSVCRSWSDELFSGQILAEFDS